MVDPSDLPEIERMTKKSMRKNIRIFDTNLPSYVGGPGLFRSRDRPWREHDFSNSGSEVECYLRYCRFDFRHWPRARAEKGGSRRNISTASHTKKTNNLTIVSYFEKASWKQADLPSKDQMRWNDLRSFTLGLRASIMLQWPLPSYSGFYVKPLF